MEIPIARRLRFETMGLMAWRSEAAFDLEPPLYRDRREAGGKLADAFVNRKIEGYLVIGLARGGVEVAAEVAQALGVPLDALAVRKVRHPWQPEYAIGAVTPGGGVYVRGHDGLTEEEVQAAVTAAQEQARELDLQIHADQPARDPGGKTVVLVDDGLATGSTMMAAVRWARAAGAGRVLVAVPVGASETVRTVEREVDEVVCLEQPALFGAVGIWYESFPQVSDERVRTLLERAVP